MFYSRRELCLYGMNMNSKPKIFDSMPPSDEFMDAVREGGGIRRQCEACGRECFEDDEGAGSWEEGELENLRKKAEKNPDQYVAMARVESGTMNGKEVVVNCPCNFLKKYEDFIWAHRHVIAKYIAVRAKQRAEKAYHDEAEAEFLEENAEFLQEEEMCEDMNKDMDEERKKEIAEAMQ